MTKYVLYEGPNGDILFTKDELVRANPNLLNKFDNKNPTWSCEAENDNSAIGLLNAQMMERMARQSK